MTPTPTHAVPEGLCGQVVVVTGAARGIGLAVAEAFAREGCELVLLDVDDLDAAVAAVDRHGVRAHPVAVDLTDRPAVRERLGAVLGRLGHVEVLVNNAGVVSRAPIASLSDEEWDRTMAVNVTAQVVTTQVVWPYLVNAGYGRLIYVSSRAARSGGVTAGAAYVASKGAVQSLTYQVSREGAQHGILANAILPGPIATEMTKTASWSDASSATPLGHLGSPEDIAAVAVFLASRGSSFMTGAVLNVTGGLLMG